MAMVGEVWPWSGGYGHSRGGDGHSRGGDEHNQGGDGHGRTFLAVLFNTTGHA